MDFKNEILMMSEEEARNRAKELLNENQVDLITKYMFLEQQCKKQKEVIDKIKKLIKQYGKYDGQKCTRGFQMWTADFNKLLEILEDKEVSE